MKKPLQIEAYTKLIPGVSGSIGIYLGNPTTNPISSTSMVINVTTKRQVILNLRSNIITAGSRYILRGIYTGKHQGVNFIYGETEYRSQT